MEQESQLLAHAEDVREGLSRVAEYHREAADLMARVDSALIELDDVNSSLQSAADGVTYIPVRQQEVDERLSLVFGM